MKKKLKYISAKTLVGDVYGHRLCDVYVCYPEQNSEGDWIWDEQKWTKKEALKRYPLTDWNWEPLDVAY